MIGDKMDKSNNIIVCNTHVPPTRDKFFFTLFTIFIIYNNKIQFQLWDITIVVLRMEKKWDQWGANWTLDWNELLKFISHPSIHSYEDTVPPTTFHISISGLQYHVSSWILSFSQIFIIIWWLENCSALIRILQILLPLFQNVAILVLS